MQSDGRSSAPSEETIANGKLRVKKAPHPWNEERPLPKEGDSSERITYAAVGKSLSKWTEFELNLARLFSTLLGQQDHTNIPPMMIFGSVRTFEGRLEMFRTATEMFFNSNLNNPLASILPIGKKADWLKVQQKDVAELCVHAHGLSQIRNNIAHGVVRPLSHAKQKRKIFALQPEAIDRKKNFYFMTPKFAYTSKELQYWTAHFERLTTWSGVRNTDLRGFLRERRRASLS